MGGVCARGVDARSGRYAIGDSELFGVSTICNGRCSDSDDSSEYACANCCKSTLRGIRRIRQDGRRSSSCGLTTTIEEKYGSTKPLGACFFDATSAGGVACSARRLRLLNSRCFGLECAAISMAEENRAENRSCAGPKETAAARLQSAAQLAAQTIEKPRRSQARRKKFKAASEATAVCASFSAFVSDSGCLAGRYGACSLTTASAGEGTLAVRLSELADASGASVGRPDNKDCVENTATGPPSAAVALADCDCEREKTAASASDVNGDSRPNRRLGGVKYGHRASDFANSSLKFSTNGDWLQRIKYRYKKCNEQKFNDRCRKQH